MMNNTDNYDEVMSTSTEPPASVTVTCDKSVPESFGSRGKARAYVAGNPGYKVVDNGPTAAHRWTVTKASAPRAVKPKTKPAPVKWLAKKAVGEPKGWLVSAGPVGTGANPAAALAMKHSRGKKEVAKTVYAELEAAGTLKRSTFLAEMETRAGLSAKGASTYFYRIKSGQW